ncbi:MAG: hypothetical protein LBJ25_07365 [Candidatus Margulisbacteria bacterium]|jgi:hypothetical protein|nr:hypothetical protein [Candidatus Margulisiibacteriota bacterium]
MTNAGNYTDTTDTDFKAVSYNIDEGQKLSAEGMRAALHTRENVANKQVSSTDNTVDTLTANSSDSYYPSAKLAGKNLDALRNGKQDKIAAGIAKNIVAYSGTAGTFGALTRTTTVESAANASEDKIPTEKALATALSGIELPTGTIIVMHNKTYYNTSDAAFRAKWKICDGNNGTPNLTNLFLRGMPDGGTDAIGGDSVTLTASNLPGHAHTVNDPGHSHKLRYYSGTTSANSGNDTNNASNGVYKYSSNLAGVDTSITNITVTGGGGSPQTAVPIVPKYFAVIYVMKVN